MRIDRIISSAVFMSLSYQKEPLAFISDLIIPLIIFMIVQLGTGKGAESLVGILVAIAWSSGSFALARKLAQYRVWRLMDMFIASPVKPLEFALASALAHLTILILPATVITIIMILLQGISLTALASIVLSIIISWFVGTSFGLYMYGRLADPLRISSVANLLNLLIILIPPVLYPISFLPSNIQLASIIIPTVSLKLLALHLIGVETGIPFYLPLVIVIIYLIIFMILAIRERITIE
jgi:ABC-2 type transport system permease protein